MLFAFVPSQQGDTASYTRVHRDRLVALAYWGDIDKTCDATVMTIPIIRVNGLRAQNLNAQFKHNIDADGNEPPFTQCKIIIDNQRWSSLYLCELIAHEMGHAKGWRAPPGQEFRGTDRFGQPTVDDWHSSNPSSIMWPYKLADWKPCAGELAGKTKTKTPLRTHNKPAVDALRTQ